MEKKLTVSLKKAKKLTVSRKKAKVLTVNRKSHYPIETLYQVTSRGLGVKGGEKRKFITKESRATRGLLVGSGRYSD